MHVLQHVSEGVTWPDPTASYVRLKGALPVAVALKTMLRQKAATAVDPLPWTSGRFDEDLPAPTSESK